MKPCGRCLAPMRKEDEDKPYCHHCADEIAKNRARIKALEARKK